MTWLDVVALGVLLGVLPLLSVLQARAFPLVEVERMPAYVSSMVTLLLLGAGAWALGVRHGGPGALGLGAMPVGTFLLWTAALVAAGLAVTLAFRWVGGTLGARETRVLRTLLPVTGRERVAFVGVSLAAGVGEEVAYRGYVIVMLSPSLGPWGAAAVSSAVFGLLHVYQGPLGMARTAALGGVLAWGFLGSGSLWPPMAAHALLDIILGIGLGHRMMVPDDPDAAQGPGELSASG